MKNITRLGLVVAFALVLVAGVYAKSTTTEAAVIINDFGCGFIGGGTIDTHAVVTPSGNGLVKCKGQVAPTASGRAEHYDFDNTGLLCGTFAGSTDIWKQTTSASGAVMLTCHVKGF